MRVNISKQEFWGVCALMLQMLTANEDLVEDEQLKKLIKKIGKTVKAPMRNYFLSNPEIRLIMKRLLPALQSDESGINTMIEIKSDRGNNPMAKDVRAKRLVKALLDNGKINEADHDFICDIHGLVDMEWKEPETLDEHRENLPLKYLSVV